MHQNIKCICFNTTILPLGLYAKTLHVSIGLTTVSFLWETVPLLRERVRQIICTDAQRHAVQLRRAEHLQGGGSQGGSGTSWLRVLVLSSSSEEQHIIMRTGGVMTKHSPWVEDNTCMQDSIDVEVSSICLSVHPTTTIIQPMYLSIHPSVCLSVYLSFIHPSSHISICLCEGKRGVFKILFVTNIIEQKSKRWIWCFYVHRAYF